MEIKNEKITDYYSVLELNYLASQSDIKKQFKKLSFMYHPDRCPLDIRNDPEKYESFCKKYSIILSAYAVLGKTKLRKEYDEMFYQEKRILNSYQLKKNFQLELEEMNNNASNLYEQNKNKFNKIMEEREITTKDILEHPTIIIDENLGNDNKKQAIINKEPEPKPDIIKHYALISDIEKNEGLVDFNKDKTITENYTLSV